MQSTDVIRNTVYLHLLLSLAMLQYNVHLSYTTHIFIHDHTKMHSYYSPTILIKYTITILNEYLTNNLQKSQDHFAALEHLGTVYFTCKIIILPLLKFPRKTLRYVFFKNPMIRLLFLKVRYYTSLFILDTVFYEIRLFILLLSRFLLLTMFADIHTGRMRKQVVHQRATGIAVSPALAAHQIL